MKELIDVIKETGEAIHMTVNTPFLMDDPERVWFIEKGNINIYTVKLNEQEIPEGKRFYFFTAGQHQILLGINSKNSDTSIGLSADATEETTVYTFSLKELKSFLKDEKLKNVILKLLTRWIDNIFYGLSENDNHPNQQADVLIKAGERLILRNGESISSQRKLVWSKINSKKIEAILVNGRGKIDANKKDLLIPISRRSFLQSERNVGMRFFTSEEAFESEAAWDGLRALDAVILHLEKTDIELIEQNETKRLKAKYENQFKRTAQTLQEAQAILHKNVEDKYAENLYFDTDDTLFNACQIVTGLFGIRLTFPVSENDFDPLGDIARASQIRYREVLLEDEWWKKDVGGLLGFLEESGTPVAIMPLGKGEYEVYNPENKTTFKIDTNTVLLLDKVAYTFYKPFPQKKITIRDIFQLGIFKEKKDFYLLIILGISATVLGLIIPVLTGVLFDSVIPNAQKTEIIQVGFALFMGLIGYILFELTENYTLLRIETKMDSRLQAAIWDRLLNLPVTFFRDYSTGDLAERALGINEIRKILSGVIITSILGSIFSSLNFFLLFYYSVRLALIALALVFIEVIFIFLLGQWQIRKEKSALEYEGKTQGIVLQLLTGIAKFRVTGTEIRAYTHWLHYFTKMKQYAYQARYIENIQVVLNTITPILFSALIYTTLILSSEFENITTGQFLAFNAAYGAFTAAMRSMNAALLTVYQVFPIYDRTRPILETLPESDQFKTNPGKLKGNIEVSQVNFRYDKESSLVLQDISFKLESGDYVALVGPSGSGKSTMVRLLLGFEKPESGSIFYDDQDLIHLDIRLVRRQIGTVLQDGQLTPGDIYSNIVGASPHLTLENAWEAAKQAALDEDIKRMPMGMHTIISEGSSTLSGGQKQRLMIAQTLVHKPRLVIFDEATSALDNQTQAIITNSLNKLQATRIVIAHRLSTIRHVDRIYVFENGRIVQRGTYDELITQEGAFQDLAKRQLG